MNPTTASRRARAAWCFFDWANSAFPTVMVTFVFSVYFVGSVAEDKITGTAQWGYALSVSGLLIAILSPVLGSIADSSGPRKPWLACFVTITVIGSALCWYAAPDSSLVFYALLVFVVANVFFELGQAFYNAMLPDLVPPDQIGRLSGWGWGLGYAGGLCCLALLLLVFIQSETPPFGLSREELEHVRISGPVSAVWFAVFCLPLFLFVPDARSRKMALGAAIGDGITTLIRNIRRIRDFRDIAWFMCARLFYVDGLNTLFAFGAVYASQTFGFGAEEIIVLAIAMNVVAGLGAVVFSWVDDWIGSKETIVIALVGLIAFGAPLLVLEGKLMFWVFGLPLAAFLGAAQSASRSLMAHLAPEEHRTEMFGLFAFSGRVTAFVGPFVLATVTTWADSQRAGMASIIVFLAVGLLILLAKVRVHRP